MFEGFIFRYQSTRTRMRKYIYSSSVYFFSDAGCINFSQRFPFLFAELNARNVILLCLKHVACESCVTGQMGEGDVK
jgi:hypothetical protein